MNKLETIVKLAELVSEGPTSTGPQAETPISGQHIVVLDRGFVYVGEVERSGDLLLIRNAKNIRRWGTTKGLGELRDGPLENTVLDHVGDVLAPFKSVIHLIECKGF